MYGIDKQRLRILGNADTTEQNRAEHNDRISLCLHMDGGMIRLNKSIGQVPYTARAQCNGGKVSFLKLLFAFTHHWIVFQCHPYIDTRAQI